MPTLPFRFNLFPRLPDSCLILPGYRSDFVAQKLHFISKKALLCSSFDSVHVRHDVLSLIIMSFLSPLSAPPPSFLPLLAVHMFTVRPLLVQIEGERKAFSAEKTIEITCRSAGSRPPASITWWKGSKALKRVKDKISIDGNHTTSTLSFTPSADDSGKYLSCRSENLLIPGSAIEDGIKLEINCKSAPLSLSLSLLCAASSPFFLPRSPSCSPCTPLLCRP